MAKKKQSKKDTVKIEDIFVSVVVSFRDDKLEGFDITKYIKRVMKLLSGSYTNYEVIIIDNHLPIRTVRAAVKLLSELPCIRIVRLSRRYEHDTAIMAGLESVIGDVAVITDPTLDPIEAIPEIVIKCKKVDVVQGVATARIDSKVVRPTIPRRLFYGYSRKHMAIDVPTNATYFIALSRRAIMAMTVSAHRRTHIRFAARTIGYTYETFPYSVKISPIRNRSLKVGAFEAADIVSSYSVHPLRLMSWIGLTAGVLSLIYAVYVVWTASTRPGVAQGWTTMSLQISGLFFILFLIVVVLAEYISKLLVETRREPRYHVSDELTSTVAIADVKRKNISNG